MLAVPGVKIVKITERVVLIRAVILTYYVIVRKRNKLPSVIFNLARSAVRIRIVRISDRSGARFFAHRFALRIYGSFAPRHILPYIAQMKKPIIVKQSFFTHRHTPTINSTHFQKNVGTILKSQKWQIKSYFVNFTQKLLINLPPILTNAPVFYNIITSNRSILYGYCCVIIAQKLYFDNGRKRICLKVHTNQSM